MLAFYVSRNKENVAFQHFKCSKSTFENYLEGQHFKHMLVQLKTGNGGERGGDMPQRALQTSNISKMMLYIRPAEITLK